MRSVFRRSCAAVLTIVATVILVALGQGEASGAVVLQNLIVTGPGPGGGPHIALFKASDAKTQINFFAYDPTFSGGVDVALGDLNADGKLEVITGAGPGGGPHVRVFTDHGDPLDAWSFFAFDAGFTGGVNVGVADIDGDEDKEILTAPASGGPPLVKVWDIKNNKPVEIRRFLAFGETFTGGVDIDGAYVDATKREGIVVGAGPGGGPHVRTFTSTYVPYGSWFAYDPAYRGGVSVTSFNEDQNPGSEIATAARTGRGHVRSFTTAGTPRGVSFYAFDEAVDTGVSIGSITGDPHGPLVVGPLLPGTPPCSALENPPNCKRGDYFRGVDDDGDWQIQNLPYGAAWRGGMRVAGGLGFFDDSGTVFNPSTTTTEPPTTTSSSTTSSSTTSTSTTSTSTTSTSTTSTSTTSSTTTSTTTAP